MERVYDARGNEALLRDNRELKQLVDKLERENRELKKAVFDLNMRCGGRSKGRGKKGERSGRGVGEESEVVKRRRISGESVGLVVEEVALKTAHSSMSGHYLPSRTHRSSHLPPLPLPPSSAPGSRNGQLLPHV